MKIKNIFTNLTGDKLSMQIFSDFFVDHAKRDKNEQSLQRIQDGENVGEYHATLAEEQKAEQPSNTQNKSQRDGAENPSKIVLLLILFGSLDGQDGTS